MTPTVFDFLCSVIGLVRGLLDFIGLLNVYTITGCVGLVTAIVALNLILCLIIAQFCLWINGSQQEHEKIRTLRRILMFSGMFYLMLRI
jgi:hypothetical protein